jgi:hypothetical protein
MESYTFFFLSLLQASFAENGTELLNKISQGQELNDQV